YVLHSNFSNYNKQYNPIWDGTHNDYLFIKKNTCVALSDRPDRLGACFISYMAQCMAADIMADTIQINHDIKYADSQFVKPLFKLFPQSDRKQVVSPVFSLDWIETLSKTVLLMKQDCLTKFSDKWKS